MDSYTCKMFFGSPVSYRICDNRILEITEKDSVKTISLTDCNPIPQVFEKKTTGWRIGFLLAGGLFCISSLPGGAVFMILQIVGFLGFLVCFLTYLRKRRRYCRFHDFQGGSFSVEFRFGKKTDFEQFVRTLQRRIGQCFQMAETRKLSREEYFKALQELQDSRILTGSEVHLLKRSCDDPGSRVPPHLFVILDVLRMDGVISEEEFQEMKYDRIFKQQSIRK